MWAVPLVVRIRASQFLEHLLACRVCPATHLRRRRGTICHLLTDMLNLYSEPWHGRWTYLVFHVLRIVLAVDVARRRLALDGQRSVTHLGRQTILEIQQTCLTDVFDLGTCLADDGRFVTSA